MTTEQFSIKRTMYTMNIQNSKRSNPNFNSLEKCIKQTNWEHTETEHKVTEMPLQPPKEQEEQILSIYSESITLYL